MSEKIKIIEVVPRDGLQNEKKPIPLEMKYRFVKNLLGAGIDNIEVSSLFEQTVSLN